MSPKKDVGGRVKPLHGVPMVVCKQDLTTGFVEPDSRGTSTGKGICWLRVRISLQRAGGGSTHWIEGAVDPGLSRRLGSVAAELGAVGGGPARADGRAEIGGGAGTADS